MKLGRGEAEGEDRVPAKEMGRHVANTIFTEEYAALVAVVASARKAAGVSQRELAARLGRSQSHVCKIEARQRRIDTLELYRIAKCLGISPTAVFQQFVDRIETAPTAPGSSRSRIETARAATTPVR
jgi:transcriptional regulator with XRE-family HTH domain